MAGNDDISREVADLLFNQTIKMGSMAGDVVPKALQGVGHVSQVAFSQVVDEFKHNREMKDMMNMSGSISMAELNEIIKKFGKTSKSIEVSNMDAKDYEALLTEQGVLYAKLDRRDDNCCVYIFLDKDLEKVENATRILQAQRGQVTELNAKLYFNSLSPDNVHVVEGMTAVERELFRYYARGQGLLYTFVSDAKGDMMVCDVSDQQKANKALLYTGWALTGANGARVREQVERRIAGRSALIQSAEEGEREMFVVSQRNPGNFVRVTSEDFEVYKNNKQIDSVPRSDPDFYAKCMYSSEALQNPVVLSAEQFRAGVTMEQLEAAHTIDLFPNDHDDEIEMNEINSFISLVAQKSGLDDEHNATWGLWDPSVSYSAFASYEFFTDQEEQEARERSFEHFKEAAYYPEGHHNTYDVNMKEKNLDYIIRKAEIERNRREEEQGDTRRPIQQKELF